nr:unnamed protein product [Callosobruchus analis]
MIYFKQKLACHNFTIYILSDNKVVCYVTHEGEGGLDANCFASCLNNLLGHTQTKYDSVHSGIEKAKKNRDIQSPSNYLNITKYVRKRPKQSYKDKYVDFDFFKCYNETKYISSIRLGLKKGDLYLLI